MTGTEDILKEIDRSCDGFERIRANYNARGAEMLVEEVKSKRRFLILVEIADSGQSD